LFLASAGLCVARAGFKNWGDHGQVQGISPAGFLPDKGAVVVAQADLGSAGA
jgi:hypothetical protein